MNIKDELTCKYCNEIYNNPITLTCGDSVCMHHLKELASTSSQKFPCPLCNQENLTQDFNVNKLITKLLEIELHKFKLEPKYELAFKNFKAEITNLESILKDPENYIYEEIAELKRQVDLDRERLKSQIDDLANDLIQQLEAYEASFRAEYKSNVDLKHYNDLVESSRKQLAEYERCLCCFSTEVAEREERFNRSEESVKLLVPKIKELKDKLFSNIAIRYRPVEETENLFGKLIIKVS